MHRLILGDTVLHLRWSTDPIIIATYKDVAAAPSVDHLFLKYEPNLVGNARAVQDEIKRLRTSVIGPQDQIWISIRVAEDGRKVSIPEVRLVAAIFGDELLEL